MQSQPTIAEHLERAKQPIDQIPTDTRAAIVQRILDRTTSEAAVEVARFTSAI